MSLLLLVAACGGGSGFEAGDLGTPYNLNVTGTSVTSVSLAWEYSGAFETTSGFRIYRDGKLVDWTAGTAITDIELWPGSAYCYRVTAYNFWSESDPSNTVCTSTPADLQPPTTPGNLIALMVESQGVSLSWSGSTDDHEVARYRILRDSQDFATATGLQFLDTSVAGGAEYCYQLSAIDPSGNESVPSAPACADTNWTLTTLDENNEIGSGLDIALDSGGNSHVSYYDKTHGELKYAQQTGGAWSVSPVDYIGEENWYPATSVAVDQAGAAHICYFDTARRELKYASRSAGAWSVEILASGESLANDCAIAIDSLDRAHVIYAETGLMYATNSTGVWTSALIPGTVGAGLVSVAVDSGGAVHASYSVPGPEIHYASNRSGAWLTQMIYAGTSASGGRWYSSIGTDTSGHAHLTFGCDTVLHYASNTSGAWVAMPLVSVSGCYPGLAVDPLGKVHISYRDDRIPRDLFTYTTALKYITNKSGDWIAYTIRTGAITGFYSQVAAAADSHAHIVALDDFRLLYATNR